jgi:hypothetical protein
MGSFSHQTTRLGRGRHDQPGPEVCVMELASMLASERFGDRPSSVCPVIGSLLRTYNDVIGDRWRDDLYRYAAEAVGTRGAGFELQRDRAEVALSWARAGYRRPVSAGRLNARRPPKAPGPDGGPDGIADYVIGSLRRRHSASAHASVLWLLDRLIAMRPPHAELPAAPAREPAATPSDPPMTVEYAALA